MCRLFGLHAGREPVNATFWLLEAPGSLLEQSHRNPDGFGLGTFEPDGSPDVDKAPLAAHVAEQFAREAREECSTTFVAHVRYASVGELTLGEHAPVRARRPDLRPQRDRRRPRPRRGRARRPARASCSARPTPSACFALITRHIRDHDGDVRAGIISATRWLAEHVELYSLNFVMATADELWALRYPEGNELWVLAPPARRRAARRARLARRDQRAMDASARQAGRRRRERAHGRRPALARDRARRARRASAPTSTSRVDLILPDPPAQLRWS